MILGAFGTKCARKLKLINSTIKTNIPAPGKYEVRSEVSRPVSVFGNSGKSKEFALYRNQINLLSSAN